MPDIGTANGKPSMIDVTEYTDRLALLTAARAGDARAIQALADRYHVRIGGARPTLHQDATPRNPVQPEVTMSDMATCDICGVEVKRQGLGVHKARKHGNGNSHKAVAKLQPSAAESTANGCSACLFRGLERAIDQELVTEAVRGGMRLDVAAAFVRRVRAAQ